MHSKSLRLISFALSRLHIYINIPCISMHNDWTATKKAMQVWSSMIVHMTRQLDPYLSSHLPHAVNKLHKDRWPVLICMVFVSMADSLHTHTHTHTHSMLIPRNNDSFFVYKKANALRFSLHLFILYQLYNHLITQLTDLKIHLLVLQMQDFVN